MNREKLEFKMHLQIFSDVVCQRELTLNIEDIPKRENFYSTEDYCKKLLYCLGENRMKKMVLNDAKKSFLKNNEMIGFNIANKLLGLAENCEKEIIHFLGLFGPQIAKKYSGDYERVE